MLHRLQRSKNINHSVLTESSNDNQKSKSSAKEVKKWGNRGSDRAIELAKISLESDLNGPISMETEEVDKAPLQGDQAELCSAPSSLYQVPHVDESSGLETQQLKGRLEQRKIKLQSLFSRKIMNKVAACHVYH